VTETDDTLINAVGHYLSYSSNVLKMFPNRFIHVKPENSHSIAISFCGDGRRGCFSFQSGNDQTVMVSDQAKEAHLIFLLEFLLDLLGRKMRVLQPCSLGAV
jgi:hypothetical protein